MGNANYEVKCLACSAEIGVLWAGRFFHHPGCSLPVGRSASTARCCRCGGSLYLEPVDLMPHWLEWPSTRVDRPRRSSAANG